ncbi:unnamed protein product, partial [Phaeothamnion confervicola]
MEQAVDKENVLPVRRAGEALGFGLGGLHATGKKLGLQHPGALGAAPDAVSGALATRGLRRPGLSARALDAENREPERLEAAFKKQPKAAVDGAFEPHHKPSAEPLRLDLLELLSLSFDGSDSIRVPTPVAFVAAAAPSSQDAVVEKSALRISKRRLPAAASPPPQPQQPPAIASPPPCRVTPPHRAAQLDISHIREWTPTRTRPTAPPIAAAANSSALDSNGHQRASLGTTAISDGGSGSGAATGSSKVPKSSS